MNNTSLHWTEDQALLEQFVLGRIPEERLPVLNEHLAECAQCRAAVEKERDFVRSVRAFGRDQLRTRLKKKLERTPSGAVPWPHILSAAAIIVVVVGLGIYNRWWVEPDLMIQSEGDIGAGKNEQGPPPPAVAGEPKGEESLERAAQPSAGVGGRLSDETVAGALGKKERQLNRALKDDRDVQPSMAEQPVEAMAADVQETQRKSKGEYWVDGILVDITAEGKALRPALKEAAAPDAKREAAGQTAASAQSGRYVLQQQPSAALPLEQQRKQKGFAAVPTKVEPTGDGAILTVYTDQIDLRNKAVQGEFAGLDSLVFVVDGVRIAYRISALPVKH